MPEWLKGADCKSAALSATLVRIQLDPKIYKPVILINILYIIKMIKLIEKIKKSLNLGTLNKFRKGVRIIRIKPIKLLTKNRGYLVIFFQKLFIN